MIELSDTNYERLLPPAGDGVAWRVRGLDLSLTATGVSDGSFCTVIRPGQLRGHPRLQYLRRELTRICQPADLIVVEGPAFGTKHQQMQHESAGWWWLATHTLWRMGKPVAVASPAEVKIYATGRGGGKGSSKEDVRVAVSHRFPNVDVHHDNNEADALVLAAMGWDWLGAPLTAMPQTHRRALSKVAWPYHRKVTHG
jgi:Holliday junction resolvasome RuvABC endonuclease subunit